MRIFVSVGILIFISDLLKIYILTLTVAKTEEKKYFDTKRKKKLEKKENHQDSGVGFSTHDQKEEKNSLKSSLWIQDKSSKNSRSKKIEMTNEN